MFSVSSIAVSLALANSAFAALAFTSPTVSTTFTAGQSATITWEDDGQAPALSAYGPCTASIYAGNAAEQTSLQLLNASIDPSQTTSFDFVVNGTIGPNSDEYFIRFQSISATDPSNPKNPLLAFSHTFTMAGMTGVFDAEVLSEIAGQSTAPIGGGAASAAPSSAGSSPSAAGYATTAGNTASTAKASGTGSGSSAKTSGSVTAKQAAASGSSAAMPNLVASSSQLWLGIVTGVAGAVMGAALL